MMLDAAHVLSNHDPKANLDSWDLLIGAIVAEAAELREADRGELVARVLALGGYESPESSDHSNASARLALRLAARLAEPSA